MSEMPFEPSEPLEDELLVEYQFDYKKAKPNRFAKADSEHRLKVVVLDEDVAQVFTTAESVNQVLRALIATMPQSSPSPQANE